MRDMKEPDNRPDLLTNMKTFNRFMLVHAVSVFLAATMYSITPLLALRKYGKYVRVFPGIYPFTYEPGGLVYWLLYALEVSGAASMWTVTVGVDCVFGVYAFQVCGELRVLAQKFRKLRDTEKYKEKLKDCIERHQVLINSTSKLEGIFGFISIWLVLSGTLVLCSVVFEVTEVSTASLLS